MLRATAVVRRPAVDLQLVADRITLDHAGRHRRRLSMASDGGLAFLLDLAHATAFEDGDALAIEDGRLVLVRAAAEALVEVRAESPLLLKQVIWHLGNRHVATEITDDAVYVLHDHVLIDMLRGLGASVALVERPFRPERGAYDATASHHHPGPAEPLDRHDGGLAQSQGPSDA